MAITYVGGATSSSTSSVSSVTLTIPTVQNGDLAVLVFGHGTTNATAPAGWTLADAHTQGTMYGEIFTRTLASGDSGATVVCTVGASQRLSATLAVYRGASGIGDVEHAGGSGTGHAVTAATAAEGGGVAVTAIAERSSTPSTTFTPPSGYSLRQSSHGTGTGAGSTGWADRLAIIEDEGNPVGAGSWTGDVSNTAIVWTLSLTPVASTPLAGTLTLYPASGVAPLTVAAVAEFTGGTGTPLEYRFGWGDGSSTGWQSSNTASHTYTVAGIYTDTVGNPVAVEARNT